MRITMVQRAAEHELFAPTAFDGQIGKPVRLKLEDRDFGTATLVAATVADDGKSVELTLDEPDWMAGMLAP